MPFGRGEYAFAICNFALSSGMQIAITLRYRNALLAWPCALRAIVRRPLHVPPIARARANATAAARPPTAKVCQALPSGLVPVNRPLI